jgi:hypothetical protein
MTVTDQTNFRRNIEQLHSLAAMFWPVDLSQQEADISIVPTLLQTQEQFIAILSVDVPSHEELFQIVDASTLPANLFLKHLSVIADVGGEKFQRYNREFAQLFPNGTLEYIRNGQIFTYKFRQLPVRGALNNERLGISGNNLLVDRELDDVLKDVSVLLMFGSACRDEDTADILAKCEIGNYLGDHEKLETFVKQRYIWVSRITGGAQANTLGQVAQRFVRDYLMERLPQYDFSQKRVPGISHSDTGSTSFDIVINNGIRWVAIEVSFQVTTNSTIERKAGQAQARYDQMEANGYKIAYVIDGAGNFQRVNAISIICSYSHCTVAFTREELDVLVRFIRDYFEG